MKDTKNVPEYVGGLRGTGYWNALHSVYEFTNSEHEILTEICRTLDLLDDLNDAIRTAGVMVTGSAGQDVLNPAVGEARQAKVTLHRLMAAMDLPDEAVVSAHSQRGKAANRARWADHVNLDQDSA